MAIFSQRWECHQQMVSNKCFGFQMAIAVWESNIATGNRTTSSLLLEKKKTCSAGTKITGKNGGLVAGKSSIHATMIDLPKEYR